MGGMAWTEEEDQLLKKCVQQYGEGKWHIIPFLSGLNRCRKSCRLRWLNYLRPNIKRGSFTEEEVYLIIRLQNVIGNRWSLIASRLLPGRTANDVKNYWNCHLRKRQVAAEETSMNEQEHSFSPIVASSSCEPQLGDGVNNVQCIEEGQQHGFVDELEMKDLEHFEDNKWDWNEFIMGMEL